MKKRNKNNSPVPLIKQSGGIGVLPIVFTALALLIFFFASSFEKSITPKTRHVSSSCGEAVTSDPITFTAPAEEIIPIDPTVLDYHRRGINEDASNLSLLGETTYTHIRTGIAIAKEQFQTPGNAGLEQHFIPWGKTQVLSNGKRYKVYYPNWATDVFLGKGLTDRHIIMNYGLIFLVAVDKNDVASSVTDKSGNEYIFTDIYQDMHNVNQIPEQIFTKAPFDAGDKGCTPLGSSVATTQTVVTPTGTTTSFDRKQLQLQTFSVTGSDTDHVWNVDCKPAVYLYPFTDTNVSVKVRPKGQLTYTDPSYGETGWHVLAHPDGTLETDGKTYPYLYFESKIQDSAFEKPDTGYLVPFDSLESFYLSLLPQLGLKGREIQEFRSYWSKKLKYSPYYFVGVVPDQTVNNIEPLTITPRPATMIRVRLYFEPRETLSAIKKPSIHTPIRNGFTVVEWGGMVKVDHTHPFTCSQ